LVAVDCPFRPAFLEGVEVVPFDEKPFAVDSPSARMIARRLRLGEGERPAARPVWRESGWLPGSDAVPAVEGLGVSEGRGRRRGLVGRREGSWGAVGGNSDSDGDAPELLAGEEESRGKGESGWSEAMEGR
jgi:hypothetical protein